jgi:hypothetical protein
MILNNYWKWLNITQTTNAYTDDYYAPVYNIGLKNLSGSEAAISPNSSQGGWETRNFANATVRFGSGSGAITADDYAMSNDCTDDIDSINVSVTSAASDDGITRTMTITGINNSGNDVTITEVGYDKVIQWYSRDDGWHTEHVLFSKTKLSEPLTLADGDSFLINLAWNEA